MGKIISGVVIGLLTLWIVPQLTRQVQDRTAERNVETSIAREMATAYSDLSGVAVFRAFDLVQRQDLDAIKFGKDGSIKRPPQPANALPPKVFNNAFVTWRKRIGQIETRLALQFPDDEDVREVYAWVMDALNSWYFVSQRPRKPTHVHPLQEAVASLNDATREHGWVEDGEVTVPLSPREVKVLKRGQANKRNIEEFYDVYTTISARIKDAQDAVIQQMKAAEAEGFSTTTCDLARTLVTLTPGRCS